MEDLMNAIETARTSLNKIQGSVNDVVVEQAILNDDANQYEITLSYRTIGTDKLSDIDANIGLASLLQISSVGRVYKTFLISKSDNSFKGFKIFKEE